MRNRNLNWTIVLNDDDEYVVDFVQRPNGVRLLLPRPAGGASDAHAVFSSKACLGADLKRWRTYNKLQEHLELEGHASFVLESHGVWLLREEWSFLTQGVSNGGSPPWVNGIAPAIPSR